MTTVERMAKAFGEAFQKATCCALCGKGGKLEYAPEVGGFAHGECLDELFAEVLKS